MTKSGSMALAIGETKADAPASCVLVSAGPLPSWKGEHRSIHVDASDPDYKVGGIDLGVAPTVSVLDGGGRPILTQLIHPTAFASQQLVLATVIEGSEGPALAVRVRLWRNTSTTRAEIERELTRALADTGDDDPVE